MSGRSTLFSRRQVGGMFALADVLAAAGAVFFVGSAVSGATDSDSFGANPDAPFATLDYAIGQCTADAGDLIVVLPGHAENVVAAHGIDADVAGITIVGCGRGSKRPTFTVKTLTTATVRIAAANVRIVNLVFTAGTAQLLVELLDVAADNVVIEDCEFRGADVATYLVKSFINITTTKDNTKIRRCRFIQGTDPAGTNAAVDTGAIFIVDSENVEIEDCEFRGNFETAFIHNRTTGAANLWVRRCFGICSLADAQPFKLVATATGGAERCCFITPAETADVEATLSGTFPAGFFNFQSFFGNDGGGGQNAIASQAAAT